MHEDPPRREEPPVQVTVVERSHGSGLLLAIVAIALILAIGFFYLSSERREDRQADAVTNAAGAVDDAARIVGDAAKNAADTLRNDER